jgi:dihydropteroate synthase
VTPRILKIDDNYFLKQAGHIHGLTAIPSRPAALCLLENPSPRLVRSIKQFENRHPGLLSMIDYSDQKLLFSMDAQYLAGSRHEKTLSGSLLALWQQLKKQADNYLDPDFLNSRLYGVDLNQVQLMGILNITPDSFSDGGQYLETDRAVSRALEMIEEGASIIDIGGESTRPGSDPVSEKEESRRVIPVISALRRHSDCLISVDTAKAAVAARALETGADWVNDISALRADADMPAVVRRFDCPVVIMHMLGTPKTMQSNPFYGNVCREVDDFFSERITALNQAGIRKIILDPGIGFGKRLQDNLDLIKGAPLFRRHGYPLLYGTSRKSFIGSITGQTAAQRLAGTLATVTGLLDRGVQLLRVHDVRATKDVIDVWKQLYNIKIP